MPDFFASHELHGGPFAGWQVGRVLDVLENLSPTSSTVLTVDEVKTLLGGLPREDAPTDDDAPVAA